jgi:hypothetical protein
MAAEPRTNSALPRAVPLSPSTASNSTRSPRTAGADGRRLLQEPDPSRHFGHGPGAVLGEHRHGGPIFGQSEPHFSTTSAHTHSLRRHPGPLPNSVNVEIKISSTDVKSTDVNRQTGRVRADLYTTEGGTTVLENIRRFVILLAGVTGLLALAPAAAQALEIAPHILANHCEPVRRSS